MAPASSTLAMQFPEGPHTTRSIPGRVRIPCSRSRCNRDRTTTFSGLATAACGGGHPLHPEGRRPSDWAQAARGTSGGMPQREGETIVLCVCRQAPTRMAQAPGLLGNRFRIRAEGIGEGWQDSPDLQDLRARRSAARNTADGGRPFLTDTWRRFGYP